MIVGGRLSSLRFNSCLHKGPIRNRSKSRFKLKNLIIFELFRSVCTSFSSVEHKKRS